MPKKIEQLYADLTRYVDTLEQSINDRVASAVGFAVRTRMLELISRGISPIDGKGRYAEYKNVTKLRRNKAINRPQRKEARIARNIARQLRKSGTRGAALKQFRDRAKALRKGLRSTKPTGYPYDTKEYRQGKKRPRPVNLWLTGAFLSALSFAILPTGTRKQIRIGWDDPEQAIKEKGHREGAGGQPKRPTLPRGAERFNQTIRLDIMKILREALIQAAKSAKRN